MLLAAGVILTKKKTRNVNNHPVLSEGEYFRRGQILNVRNCVPELECFCAPEIGHRTSNDKKYFLKHNGFHQHVHFELQGNTFKSNTRKVTEVLFLQNKNGGCWKKIGPNHYCEPIRGAMIVRIVHFLRRPSFEQLIHKIRVRCFRITTNIKYPLCLYHIWTFC